MNLFAWIKTLCSKKRSRNMQIEVPIVSVEVFSTDISKIMCFSAKCYFNQAYKGEYTCRLKEIQIDETGQCADFCDRRCAANAIHKKDTK